MKKNIIFLLPVLFLASQGITQRLQPADVPKSVRLSLAQKYPSARNVTWEKEKGNYEANWGGKSGEDFSVHFMPSGNFIEICEAVNVKHLSKAVLEYCKMHFKDTGISEACKVTDSTGMIFFEVELRGKDYLFDGNGHFLKEED